MAKVERSSGKIGKTGRRTTGRYRYALGLMAGTSGDGIDAAVIRVEGRGEAMQVRFVLHHQVAFDRRFRNRLLAAMAPATTTTQEIARLHAELGEAFGRVAREAIEQLPRAHRPMVIGLAGQTVCHLPGRAGSRTVTLQLGNAATVAAMTGLPVVFDFRQTDVAVGGQGAPLVPWTDYVLFKSKSTSWAVQNIGGIGNVTWVPAGGRAADVIAFDTGPGNMVIDGLVARMSGGRWRMDRDGRLAAKGRVLESVLAEWLKLPFFRQRPPRTTGRELFGQIFVNAELDRLRSASAVPEDWIATATAFTARTIAASYRRFLSDFSTRKPDRAASRVPSGAARPRRPAQVVLTGGGSRNKTLISMLQAELPGTPILTIDELGIPAQAKEAVSFAMLAIARLDGTPSNPPAVTGATRSVSLGCLCPQL